MAERDRAKRLLLLRLALFVCIPLIGLAIAGFATGNVLWGLGGLAGGAVVAVVVTGRLLR